MTIGDEEKIWEIIEAVLNGDSTPAENQILEDWLNSNPANRKTFETLKKIGLKEKLDSPDIKRNAFAKIQTKIEEEKVTRQLKIWRFSAVASVVIILGLGITYFFSGNFNSSSVAFIETRSPLGTKTKLTLPDSSVVYLSAGSMLKYPAVFNKATREVELDGEAFFEVSKDAKHQFIVHTTHMDVKVFGTRFNVKAYTGDKYSVTTLVEGSVGVYNNHSKNKETANLKPNQQAICSNGTEGIQLRDVNAKLYSDWKNDRYYFENETFESIARDIERNYNVIIQINYEELLHEKFTGLLDKRKPVYQILEGLAQYGNFAFNTKNDTIFIQKR